MTDASEDAVIVVACEGRRSQPKGMAEGSRMIAAERNQSMDEIFTAATLILSLVLQVGTAIWALSLYNVRDGFRVSWVAYTIALSLMALRRAISLYHWYGGGEAPDQLAEFVALTISVSMLICVAETMRIVKSEAYHINQLDLARQRALVALSHVEAIRLSSNGVKTEKALDQLGEVAARLEKIVHRSPATTCPGKEDENAEHRI